MGNKMAMGKRLGVILAVALVAVVSLAACGPAPAGPVEGRKVVEIGYISPATGYAASAEQVVLAAFEDYFRYFNEEGTIPGVTLRLSWVDTQTQMPQAISAYVRFVERGVPLIFTNQTNALATFKLKAAKDEVPVITASTTADLVYPPGWLYSLAPTYAEQFAAWADYIMANWKEERPPRVAFMIADTEWGRLPVEEGTKYAQSIGIEMLPVAFTPFVTLDATTQLIRLSDQEADFVYIQGLTQTVGPVLRDAERMDLLGKMQFGGSGHSMGDALSQMAGPAAEGFTGARTAAWLDETDVPGVKLYIDNQMKYHGKVLRAPEYTTSWPAAAVVCETVRRAIEEVGYENLDRPAVKEVLDNMRDFDVYGIWKVSYTPEDHRGTSAAAVYEIRDGKIIRVSDWRDMPMLIP